MNQSTFSNKIYGKLKMSIADIEAWRIYMSDDKQPPHEDKIINLHPQPNVEVLKKGRGRPKKIIQPAIIPEIIPELIIHQHPVFTSKGSDQGELAPSPEPQLKRGVGRPKKILFIGHGC